MKPLDLNDSKNLGARLLGLSEARIGEAPRPRVAMTVRLSALSPGVVAAMEAVALGKRRPSG